MVACKTFGEYKRNQEKIRKFCLDERADLAKNKRPKQNNCEQPLYNKRQRHKTNRAPVKASLTPSP